MAPGCRTPDPAAFRLDCSKQGPTLSLLPLLSEDPHRQVTNSSIAAQVIIIINNSYDCYSQSLTTGSVPGMALGVISLS